MKLFDVHTHLQDKKYEENGISIDQLIRKAHHAGVQDLCVVSYDLISSFQAIQIAESYDNVYASVGIHPNDVIFHSEKDFFALNELAKNPKVVAIGEIGLDYYYSDQEKAIQKLRLKDQLLIAKNLNLTAMFHIRDKKDQYNAYDDLLNIINDVKVDKKIVHCFSANLEYAQKFIAQGCLLSIGGVVTFNNSKELQEVVRAIDLKHIILETDAPYLTPHPYRGQMNDSSYLPLVCKKIAELKRISEKEVAEITFKNTLNVFNIKH